MTKGGVYKEILPELEGNPESGARGNIMHGSLKSSLGNTLCLHRREYCMAIFKYSIVR